MSSVSGSGKILPPLTRADTGRFAVIVFEQLETYLTLDNWNRQLLDKYCRDFNVGVVAFVQPDELLYNAQVCVGGSHLTVALDRSRSIRAKRSTFSIKSELLQLI